MKSESFTELAIEVMRDAGIQRQIDRASNEVVVLERLARAAGRTNWYVLHSAVQLDQLACRLSPGSSVSFYADGRLELDGYSDEAMAKILRIAERDHDAVVGTLASDGIGVDVVFITGRSDLEAFSRELGPSDRIMYGAFPARDNDGVDAITIDLPDRDGIVRRHPH